MTIRSLLARYLVYRLYQSGLSNERLSLEIAVGLAVATGRNLLLYSNSDPSRRIAATNGGGYRLHESGWYARGRQWMPPYRATNVIDMYEKLPIDIRSFDCLNSYTPAAFDDFLSAENSFPAQLTSCCASVPFLRSASGLVSDDTLSHDMCAQFMDQRPFILPPKEGPWILKGSNLGGFYSRFFFDPYGVVRAAMHDMKLCKWITKFAEKASRRLGVFNGCHIRLTDMLRFLPQASDYSDFVADVVASWIPAGQSLLIASDEISSSEFFVSLRKKFPNIIFLDDFLKHDCQDLWKDMPFVNESVLGLLIVLIMEKSVLFMGTPGSTFSGFIHRGWAQNRCKMPDASAKVFRYVHNGLFGTGSFVDGYFEQGAYIESFPGLYSWNRIQIRSAMKGQLAWYREWPECISSPSIGAVG